MCLNKEGGVKTRKGAPSKNSGHTADLVKTRKGAKGKNSIAAKGQARSNTRDVVKTRKGATGNNDGQAGRSENPKGRCG